jgi:hypothetical protein
MFRHEYNMVTKKSDNYICLNREKKNLWIVDMVNDMASPKSKLLKLNKVLINCYNVKKIPKNGYLCLFIVNSLTFANPIY